MITYLHTLVGKEESYCTSRVGCYFRTETGLDGDDATYCKNNQQPIYSLERTGHQSLMSFCRQLLLYLLSISYHHVKASSAAGQETLIGIKGRDFVILGADSSASSSITVTSNRMDKITLISNPHPFPEISGFHKLRQQVIAVASVGDRADCERLLGQLSIHATQMEYENGLGSDVKRVFHKGMTEDAFQNKKFNLWKGGLDAETAAYLARDRIAKNMRTKNRLNTCLLIGGMVATTGFLGKRDSKYLTRDDGVTISEQNNHETVHESSFADQIQAQVQAATSWFESGSAKTSARTIACVPEPNSNDDYEPKLFWLDEYGSLMAIEYGAHGLGSNFILSILDRKYKSNLTREEGVQIIKDCFEQLRSRYIINSPNPPFIKCIDCYGCRKY